MRAELVYSPGYQIPLWLGPAQVRLWRRLDRLIGSATFQRTTVRELAAELGVNPGSVSRDLDRLQALGLAVHDATWGRAGVRLWRVLARGGRRGLDPVRRHRAIARMRVALADQATLFADSPDQSGPVPSPRSGSPDDPPAFPPTPAGPFASERCTCGRLRLVRTDAERTPCTHRPDVVTEDDPGSDHEPTVTPTVTPTPAATIACYDYTGHRFHHRYGPDGWRCRECFP